ncbi:MAG: hypothetical protein COW30_02550 [Rhodospirillales bacterium CG15_BIG_FIL_POST_REV_8_21_14_020_66_15]|nr:MAG: hypothetical protein COW30_02550 [Rhodospirillales bacterium CG15_BIG_FIL_POST_REV_8_21_14_020_66_15]
MEVNAQNLTGLRTAFNTTFNQHFEAVTPTYTKVAMTVPSMSKSNDYRWMGKLSKMKEWLGQRQIQSLSQSSFVIANKSFENTVSVDRDDIDDDSYGVYNPLFGDLGQTAAEFPDELIWSLLNDGFTTNCFDGQYFFDTDHPVIDANGAEQSVSNFQGGAGTAWFLLDVTRAIKPLIFQDRRKAQFVAKDNPTDERVFMNKEFSYGVDMRCNAGYGLWQLAYASKQTLNAANYAAARAAMMSLKGDHDRPLRIRPTLLVAPPSLESAALAVLKAEKDAAGATNVYLNTADLHIEQLLTA